MQCNFLIFNFIYLICKLVVALRWLLPKKQLTLTGTTGNRYLYSTGQARTLQGGSFLLRPRYHFANLRVAVFSLSDNVCVVVALVTLVAVLAGFFFAFLSFLFSLIL